VASGHDLGGLGREKVASERDSDRLGGIVASGHDSSRAGGGYQRFRE
jgi:hypothetical protein